MKKIMFNDKYGLTQAVLEGKKTMTRRLLKVPIKDLNDVNYALRDEVNLCANKTAIIKKYAAYVVGEEVAVAQSYKTLIEQGYLCRESDGWVSEEYCATPGYSNKMFVKAELMPVKIKITGIDFEHLQDISDEDCLAEGIMYDPKGAAKYGFRYGEGKSKWYRTPKDAFSSLIDRINGKGTWDSNPWVYAYSFGLLRKRFF